MPRTIGILLFDGVEELDAVGPYEVLAWWTQSFPDDGWAVTTISRDGRPVTAAKRMVLTPEHSLADAPSLDVVLHPGGDGRRALSVDADWLDRVRALAAAAEITTSVCTGAHVLAAAGLLAGRPATTYWSAFDDLLALDPSIEVRPDDRFVDDDDVITSAGVSAGIDMALHLVRRLAGEERARQVRRGIQYDSQPPV